MRASFEVPIRWSDIDGYGHVNNVAVLGLMQEARSHFFAQLKADGFTEAEVDAADQAEALVFVVHQEIEYLAQIPYGQQPVVIEMWVTTVKGAELGLGFEVHDAGRQITYALAANTIALVDPVSRRPRRITGLEKQGFDRCRDSAPRFRYRLD